MKKLAIRHLMIILIIVAMMSATSSADEVLPKQSAEKIALDIYKSPTCGCCNVWIDHLEERGFLATIHHPRELGQVKKNYGIPVRVQSCHTAVSEEGYIFEGHIPASVIERFLREKPADSIGLTVPGMPVGSPGMEVGEKFMPYQVLLLKKSGATEVYTEVLTQEEQYE